MTSIVAAVTTAAPFAAIASPRIASDDLRPVGMAEAGLFDLWERRNALIAETRAMWDKYKEIDPSGHVYEELAGPVMKSAWAMEREVQALPPSVNKAAAMLMVSFGHVVEDACETIDDSNHEPIVDLIIGTIESLLPVLSGPIARDANELFTLRDRPLCQAPFVC